MPYVMEITAQPVFDKAKAIIDLIEGRTTTRYLRAFDANAHHGHGEIDMTDDIREARRFDTFEAVFECWKTQSTAVPYRTDGKPNRPLTAYSVSPLKVDG